MLPVVNFREQLDFLEREGLVRHFTKPVEAKFELSAVAKKLEEGPALFFENVAGYDMPVVIGTDNSRARIAKALGVDNSGLNELYANAIQNPLAPEIVNDGPVKENVIESGIDLLKLLPIPIHHEKNAGHYITTGLFVAEDEETGVRNVSYHRLQVTGKNELRAMMLKRHLWQMVQEHWARGKALPVAISIGNDIAVRLAAATWGSKIPYGFDEFSIAGAMRGKAVPLVKCRTNCVHVPADCEIVIEGRIEPGAIGPEGGFAELTGNYAAAGEGYIIKVDAITHRTKPIFQDLLVFTPEHHLLLGLPLEAPLYMSVKGAVPGLVAAHVTPGGCGKFHAVLSIRKKLPGDARDAIIAGFYSVRDIKLVTVVDHDVDPFSPREVEWAVATRFQADRDVLVVSGANGNALDHSCPERAVTAKMGIDATYPLGRDDYYEKIRVPGEDTVDPSDYD